MKAIDAALKLAEKTRQQAYAPYSNFHVGAVLKGKQSSKLFSGCNVENASFGATICAERSAVSQMISETGVQEIEFVLILTENAVPPCGMCLQVLNEFCAASTPILLAQPGKIQKEYTFDQLLPLNFSKVELSPKG